MSRLPKRRRRSSLSRCCAARFVAYLNWGLSIALSPVIAIHFAKEAERKGIPVDFLFLLATLAGAGSIWQFGFSGSAPLLMATPGHFLEKTTGIMPLSTTIWSPAAIILVITFTIATMIVGCVFMPKRVRPISYFARRRCARFRKRRYMTRRGPVAMTFAQRLEHSRLVMAPLVIMLAGWLYYHFFVKNLSLDINSVNTIVLLPRRRAARHRLPIHARRCKDAVGRAWPIVLMYHLYAGVAGLIQFTPVGDFLITLFNPVLTEYSYPVLTALISTVVALFIPTSGGQWLIQGYVTVETAALVGVTPQRGLLALSVGDHMGNLITPFWAVVGASIARIDFRQYFGTASFTPHCGSRWAWWLSRFCPVRRTRNTSRIAHFARFSCRMLELNTAELLHADIDH